ncbi:MAG: flagellar biosynthetic protein FliO [Acidobacteriota bacterium]|nr:flagellar biosynthetic protein FliO [Acidobacteriota bacterium]
MESGLSFLWMMVQTILALAVVCGLAYLLFRVILPKFNFAGSSGSMVRVVDRVTIDARKSLCVVEVAGKWLLVAISEAGVQLVSELDAESARIAEGEIAAARENSGTSMIASEITGKISQALGKKRVGK